LLSLLVDDVVEEEGEYVSIGGIWLVVVVVVVVVVLVVVLAVVVSLLPLLSIVPVGGYCDMIRARFELDNEGDKLKSSSAGRFFWPKNCVILPDMKNKAGKIKEMLTSFAVCQKS
jgi:hypothetical protein